jgi:hypothetical protein
MEDPSASRAKSQIPNPKLQKCNGMSKEESFVFFEDGADLQQKVGLEESFV